MMASKFAQDGPGWPPRRPKGAQDASGGPPGVLTLLFAFRGLHFLIHLLGFTIHPSSMSLQASRGPVVAP
eukprot:8800673-Pyramimonas_sp.AAC.1